MRDQLAEDIAESNSSFREEEIKVPVANVIDWLSQFPDDYLISSEDIVEYFDII